MMQTHKIRLIECVTSLTMFRWRIIPFTSSSIALTIILHMDCPNQMDSDYFAPVSKTNQQENLVVFHREMTNHRQDENLNRYILSQTLTSHWMERSILDRTTARIYSISLLMWNLQFELFLQSHNNCPTYPVLNLSGNGHFESPANHITMKSSQNWIAVMLW